ncbi:hypothetical protein B0H11DRAFT_1935274 [Mycena galericulata]|nr:hypothetical protein B0H11DRAFT_1935274 [Mycena galericulata]
MPVDFSLLTTIWRQACQCVRIGRTCRRTTTAIMTLRLYYSGTIQNEAKIPPPVYFKIALHRQPGARRAGEERTSASHCPTDLAPLHHPTFCAPCLASSGMSAENDIQLHMQRWAHEFVAAVHAQLGAGAGARLARLPIQAACVGARPAESPASLASMYTPTSISYASHARIPLPQESITAQDKVPNHIRFATASSPGRAYWARIATTDDARLAAGAMHKRISSGSSTQNGAYGGSDHGCDQLPVPADLRGRDSD